MVCNPIRQPPWPTSTVWKDYKDWLLVTIGENWINRINKHNKDTRTTVGVVKGGETCLRNMFYAVIGGRF